MLGLESKRAERLPEIAEVSLKALSNAVGIGVELEFIKKKALAHERPEVGQFPAGVPLDACVNCGCKLLIGPPPS